MKKLVLGLTAVFAFATSVPAMADEAPPSSPSRQEGRKEGRAQEGRGKGEGKKEEGKKEEGKKEEGKKEEHKDEGKHKGEGKGESKKEEHKKEEGKGRQEVVEPGSAHIQAKSLGDGICRPGLFAFWRHKSDKFRGRLDSAGQAEHAAAVPASVYFVSPDVPKSRRYRSRLAWRMNRATDHARARKCRRDCRQYLWFHRCRQRGIGRYHPRNGGVQKTGRCRRLVVTGCLSQRYPDELHREIPEIDHILGSGSRQSRASDKGQRAGGRCRPSSGVSLRSHNAAARVASALFRYVKIAEGCDRPCGFCIIPKTARSTAESEN